MSRKKIEAIHEWLTRMAKAQLMEKGRLAPMLHYVVPAGGLKEKLALMGMQSVAVIDDPSAPPDEPALVAFSGAHDPSTIVRQYISSLCIREKPKAKALLMMCELATASLGSEQLGTASVLHALKQRKGWDEKDIQAETIRGCIEQLGAFAFIKADETWLVKVKSETPEAARRERRAMPESLEHVPGRQEMLLVTLESGHGIKLNAFRMVRERPEDPQSKLLGLEDDEMLAKVNGHAGRFLGFFKELN